MREPELLSFLTETSSADELEHRYYMIKGLTRTKELLAVIEAEDPPSAIVFVNTRRECEQLSNALKRRGLDAERMSGDMDQPERERKAALHGKEFAFGGWLFQGLPAESKLVVAKGGVAHTFHG